MIIDLYHAIELHVLSLVMAFPRVLAFLSTALIFSQSSMTRIGRNVLVITLCIPLVPLLHADLDRVELEPAQFVLILAKEYAVGFCLGYTIGWVFWTVQAAGALIDNQRGAAIAESVDPLQGHQSSPLGNLFSQAITVYMFISGGMLLLIGILYESYLIWPAWSYLPGLTEEFPILFLSILDTGMRLAFVYAAPVVSVMFLAEMSLAMISRFAPQIQVFILAMPIKSGLALFILIFYVVLLFPNADGKRGQARQFAMKMFQTFTPGSGGSLPDGYDGPIRGIR